MMKCENVLMLKQIELFKRGEDIIKLGMEAV